MAQRETNIFKQIQMAVSQCGGRLLRNNRGLFYTLDKQRKIRAGLEAPGSSDGIGWTTVVITPDMVGRKVAVFTAIEAKSATGRVSDDQKRFIDNVKLAGGLAGVARSPEEAVSVLKGFKGA